MREVTVVIIIVYIVCLFPAIRTALAFYLFKEEDEVANNAMRNGFIVGFLKIWVIYPFYIIKDCYEKKEG